MRGIRREYEVAFEQAEEGGWGRAPTTWGVHNVSGEAHGSSFLMSSSARPGRIDLGVTDEQDAIIRGAAAASGRTVTAFLLNAAEQRAEAGTFPGWL